MMNTMAIPVKISAHPYEVHVGHGLLSQLANYLPSDLQKGRCAVIADSNVNALFGETAVRGLEASGLEVSRLSFAAGEASKCMRVAESLCEQLAGLGFDRNSFLVALGGGVTGDLVGFVASIYFRGIPCVQVPTTIVSLVDSSVGGKTGVNLGCGKNLVGAFHQPAVVIADLDALNTLPKRERNEGFAEIIKHGIIRDRAMLSLLTASLEDPDKLQALIARNIEIKAMIVEADERETLGLRALLNFGHTIGHGIENAAGYGRFLHGEAISLGIRAACEISILKAGLDPKEADEIRVLLEHFDLPTCLPEEISTQSVMEALKLDKKFARGQVRFVLCPVLGQAFVSKDVSLDEIEAAVEALRSPWTVVAEH